MRAGRIASLAVAVAALLAIPGSARAQGSREVFVVTVNGMTYPGALAHPVIDRVARVGGIGLLIGNYVPREPGPGPLEPTPVPLLDVPLSHLESAMSASDAARLMVVVVGSPDGEPDWVVVGSAPPEAITTGRGPVRGLTSDTTRVHGVVSGADVVATIRSFRGDEASEFSGGSPIRIEGEPPTDLYRRAIAHRRVADPVRIAVLVTAIVALFVGVVLVLVRAPPRVRVAVAVVGLFAVAAMVALVPASVLPTFELVVLVPALTAIAGLLLAGAILAGRRDHAAAVAVVAVAGLVFMVADGVLGWPTEVTPLLGGGALLGVRFYGLGNSGAGILMAGAVLGAAWVRPWVGTALLVGAALFAGLPFLGADLGGGVTLFGVAALWGSWSLRDRLDGWALAAAGGAVILGTAFLVAVHAAWPDPTHVSGALDAAGPTGLLNVAVERLAGNIRTTTEVWPAWIAVLGLPVWLLVAARRAGPFEAVLERRPWWRAAVTILAVGGMIGFVVNDTYGMAAATFAFVSAAMVYPALREAWPSD